MAKRKTSRPRPSPYAAGRPDAAAPAPSRRMDRRELVLAAVGALVGLYALGTAVTWLQAMLEEGIAGYVLLSAMAVVGALAMVAAVPVTVVWRERPRWALVALPLVGGVGGVCAAVCLWFVAMLQACQAEGVCRPVHTWFMMPALLACAALSALGPAWAALWLRGARPAGRLWALAAVCAVVAFVVGMAAWVEVGLYPGG